MKINRPSFVFNTNDPELRFNETLVNPAQNQHSNFTVSGYKNILYLSPEGDDSMALPNNPKRPYKNFFAARYHAQAGDLIWVMAGEFTLDETNFAPQLSFLNDNVTFGFFGGGFTEDGLGRANYYQYLNQVDTNNIGYSSESGNLYKHEVDYYFADGAKVKFFPKHGVRTSNGAIVSATSTYLFANFNSAKPFLCNIYGHLKLYIERDENKLILEPYTVSGITTSLVQFLTLFYTNRNLGGASTEELAYAKDVYKPLVWEVDEIDFGTVNVAPGYIPKLRVGGYCFYIQGIHKNASINLSEFKSFTEADGAANSTATSYFVFPFAITSSVPASDTVMEYCWMNLDIKFGELDNYVKNRNMGNSSNMLGGLAWYTTNASIRGNINISGKKLTLGGYLNAIFHKSATNRVNQLDDAILKLEIDRVHIKSEINPSTAYPSTYNDSSFSSVIITPNSTNWLLITKFGKVEVDNLPLLVSGGANRWRHLEGDFIFKSPVLAKYNNSRVVHRTSSGIVVSRILYPDIKGLGIVSENWKNPIDGAKTITVGYDSIYQEINTAFTGTVKMNLELPPYFVPAGTNLIKGEHEFHFYIPAAKLGAEVITLTNPDDTVVRTLTSSDNGRVVKFKYNPHTNKWLYYGADLY